MNAEYESDSAETIDHESIETGEPIGALLDAELPTSSGFLDSLRRRIERRRLANSVTGLAWNAPIAVFLEIVGTLFQLLGIEYRHEDSPGAAGSSATVPHETESPQPEDRN